MTNIDGNHDDRDDVRDVLRDWHDVIVSLDETEPGTDDAGALIERAGELEREHRAALEARGEVPPYPPDDDLGFR